MMATTPFSSSSSLKKYYNETNDHWIRHNFKDFDDSSDFPRLEILARSAGSKNFVLDFGHDEALITFDVGRTSLQTLLRTRV